jgi:hypothetical protein
MWIYRNSEKNPLLANLKAQNVFQVNGINMYDFSTLYTTIPHYKLKSRLLVSLTTASFTKNWKRKYPHLVTSHQKRYFANTILIPRTTTPKLKLKRCWNFS